MRANQSNHVGQELPIDTSYVLVTTGVSYQWTPTYTRFCVCGFCAAEEVCWLAPLIANIHAGRPGTRTICHQPYVSVGDGEEGRAGRGEYAPPTPPTPPTLINVPVLLTPGGVLHTSRGTRRLSL